MRLRTTTVASSRGNTAEHRRGITPCGRAQGHHQERCAQDASRADAGSAEGLGGPGHGVSVGLVKQKTHSAGLLGELIQRFWDSLENWPPAGDFPNEFWHRSDLVRVAGIGAGRYSSDRQLIQRKSRA